jgi:SAM-dependent methyltransferase
VTEAILRSVAGYYGGKFEQHGATPAGVDWNSSESQEVRFRELLRVAEGDPSAASLNDFGCGYAALVPYLDAHTRPAAYCGFDIVESMLAYARAQYGDHAWVHFVSRAEDLPVADYTVASGIFNVRLDVPDEAWRGYILETLSQMAGVSRIGFALNMLTAYSDPERMREDLYYGDPGFFFDHCMRTYSRNVALLHDYGLYEFTLIVRLG